MKPSGAKKSPDKCDLSGNVAATLSARARLRESIGEINAGQASYSRATSPRQSHLQLRRNRRPRRALLPPGAGRRSFQGRPGATELPTVRPRPRIGLGAMKVRLGPPWSGVALIPDQAHGFAAGPCVRVERPRVRVMRACPPAYVRRRTGGRATCASRAFPSRFVSKRLRNKLRTWSVCPEAWRLRLPLIQPAWRSQP